MPDSKVAVDVVLPVVLVEAVGASRVRVQASTLDEALEVAYEKLPVLRHHICEDNGSFRTHVLCFHNGKSTRDMKSMRIPLKEDDEITIVQAISGG